MKKNVGIIGWRGMVGSVLMDRMIEERDFEHFVPHFYSTTLNGYNGPDLGEGKHLLKNAKSIAELQKMDIVISCQGGDYTTEMYPQLRKNGWNGYWIDAASTLRMSSDSMIILDPVNEDRIKSSLQNGIKDYIGGNCTVSLMLMAVAGLYKQNLVEWMTSMTYQAASGAGANNMRELLEQMSSLTLNNQQLLNNPAENILSIDRGVTEHLRSDLLPKKYFGVPLAGSLIPWIDKELENGQSREEWKGFVETNKILGTEANPIPVDGTCVRVGAMRCHSQAMTIKLKKNIPLDEINDMISSHNSWVELVPNHKDETLQRLSPVSVSGTLTVPIGRIRKMKMGDQYLNAFTCGDQLLWGAAEPLRRMLRLLI